MSVVTIGTKDVRYEKGHRLFKCPKCRKGNRVEHQHLLQKIFLITCKRCGTKYRPK